MQRDIFELGNKLKNKLLLTYRAQLDLYIVQIKLIWRFINSQCKVKEGENKFRLRQPYVII